MNILLLGAGGREHGLCWKLAQSPAVQQLYASPGNPGMAQLAQLVALDASDHAQITDFCREKAIDLVVIGPEAPLVDGLADSCRAAGFATFGPSQAAAQLEGSKGFTKELCARAGIPTAGYRRCHSLAEATEALEAFTAPFVLKADGLAAGKGVVIAADTEEAHAALADMFDGRFDAGAGAQVVIEEFLEGEEASFFVLSDGEAIIPFGTAQDHKRAFDGDKGPNTGGMGAYSPAPVLTQALQQEVIERIIQPTIETMRAEGMPYSGVLYAGLMLTADGPKLIEYNCRFGDPECQVLMMRLESDLAALMMASATGYLAGKTAQFSADFALGVVMAAKGYPSSVEKGAVLDLGQAQASSDVEIFLAGTAMREGQLTAHGGRVLMVAARGKTASEAQRSAYAGVDAIKFPDGFCRRDIGWREVERERGLGAG